MKDLRLNNPPYCRKLVEQGFLVNDGEFEEEEESDGQYGEYILGESEEESEGSDLWGQEPF